MTKKQRPSYEIMQDLLSTIATQGGQQTTDEIDVTQRRVMRSANLNYQQLHKYLSELEDRGFIVCDGEGRELAITLTEKGKTVLDESTDGPSARLLLREDDRRILSVLEEGRNTAANIASRLEYDRQYVYYRLMWLSDQGYVENIGNGLFEQAPPASQATALPGEE